MIETVAVLALIWAIAATIIAIRRGRRVRRAAIVLGQMLEASEMLSESFTAMSELCLHWQELYAALARRTGQPVPRSDPAPRDLLN